jgi:hypothetical protein
VDKRHIFIYKFTLKLFYMPNVSFIAPILKSGLPGHQSNWTYVLIPLDVAQQLKAGNKKEFKVKGKLDNYAINRVSVFPLGDGSFILPLNGAMRKGTAKNKGAMLAISLTEDKSDFIFNTDFIECLMDEPRARIYFETLTGSHQRYFSKWIDSAKTDATKVKRITMAVNALAQNMGYSEMIREGKTKK